MVPVPSPLLLRYYGTPYRMTSATPALLILLNGNFRLSKLALNFFLRIKLIQFLTINFYYMFYILDSSFQLLSATECLRNSAI